MKGGAGLEAGLVFVTCVGAVALVGLLVQALFNLKVSDSARGTLWGIVAVGIASALIWVYLNG